jgi:hypothetical protein
VGVDGGGSVRCATIAICSDKSVCHTLYNARPTKNTLYFYLADMLMQQKVLDEESVQKSDLRKESRKKSSRVAQTEAINFKLFRKCHALANGGFIFRFSAAATSKANSSVMTPLPSSFSALSLSLSLFSPFAHVSRRGRHPNASGL